MRSTGFWLPLLLLAGPSLAGAEIVACPLGTTHAAWREDCVLFQGKAHGCVLSNGTRHGPVKLLRTDGVVFAEGSYRQGLREGLWEGRIGGGTEASAPDTEPWRRFWFARGRNLGLEGGRLVSDLRPKESGDAGAGTTVTEAAIDQLELEVLPPLFCRRCAAFYMRVGRDGWVYFEGHRDLERMGPHCGKLDGDTTGLLLRLAERAHPFALDDVYWDAGTDADRLGLVVRSGDREKKVGLVGSLEPRGVRDLAMVAELVIPRIEWSIDRGGECGGVRPELVRKGVLQE